MSKLKNLKNLKYFFLPKLNREPLYVCLFLLLTWAACALHLSHKFNFLKYSSVQYFGKHNFEEMIMQTCLEHRSS